MFVRAYLRASTVDQDANRARDQLKAFAADRGLSVAAWYVENESGAKLSRPELFRLLADAQPGDIVKAMSADATGAIISGPKATLRRPGMPKTKRHPRRSSTLPQLERTRAIGCT